MGVAQHTGLPHLHTMGRQIALGHASAQAEDSGSVTWHVLRLNLSHRGAAEQKEHVFSFVVRAEARRPGTWEFR